MKDDDKYLTVAQVAALFSVSRSTVYYWVKHQKFPRQKRFGGTARWSLFSILEWTGAQPSGAYGEGGHD